MRAQNLLICKFSVLAGIIMVAVSPVTFCYLIMGIPEATCICSFPFIFRKHQYKSISAFDFDFGQRIGFEALRGEI